MRTRTIASTIGQKWMLLSVTWPTMCWIPLILIATVTAEENVKTVSFCKEATFGNFSQTMSKSKGKETRKRHVTLSMST